MAELLDLDNLYKHLEEKAIDYKYRDIANLFQKIRDKMHVEKKADLEAITQWEMNVFNFSITQNVVSPSWTLPDSNGKLVSHPTYDDFSPDSYDYIIRRLDSTNNPMLKTRYAHVLWWSPKKHGKYAQLAIDGYLELIKLYEQKDKKNPQNSYKQSKMGYANWNGNHNSDAPNTNCNISFTTQYPSITARSFVSPDRSCDSVDNVVLIHIQRGSLKLALTPSDSYDRRRR